MKRLKAFTIVETIVVLVLTAVIMSLVGSIYLFMQSSHVKYRSINDYTLSKEKLYYMMRNDVISADAIVISESGFECLNDQNTIVRYIFSEKKIERIEQDQRRGFEFESVELNTNEINNKLIDQISLNIDRQDHSFCICKEYGADQLMKFE